MAIKMSEFFQENADTGAVHSQYFQVDVQAITIRQAQYLEPEDFSLAGIKDLVRELFSFLGKECLSFFGICLMQIKILYPIIRCLFRNPLLRILAEAHSEHPVPLHHQVNRPFQTLYIQVLEIRLKIIMAGNPSVGIDILSSEPVGILGIG